MIGVLGLRTKPIVGRALPHGAMHEVCDQHEYGTNDGREGCEQDPRQPTANAVDRREDDIAGRPPINISYTGRKTATDKTRKWSPWTIAANSCAQIERTNGTALVAMGGGLPGVGGGGATGKIYQLSSAQLSDDGTAIPSHYTTHYFPERPVEQSLNLGAHRKLFSYLTMYVEGAGSLGLTSFTDSSSVPQAQQSLPLSSPATKDLELPINILGERVAFQVSTNQSGSWFRLQKFIPSLRVDPWSPVRGMN